MPPRLSAGRTVIARAAIGLVVLLIAAAALPVQAQYSADQPVGATAQQAPSWQKHAGIDQNLNGPLPLKDTFNDESGRTVQLGDYFNHGRPVMMALMYYNCRLLCPEVLHGMAIALRQSGFHAGKEYDVVVTSIDPTDKPSDAVGEKQHFLSMIDAPNAGASVHFLTGQQSSITDLAQAIGFHYVRVPGPDGKMDQFAHSSVIMIATPDGRMSKYLFGVDYQSRDVRLALIQASTHHIGSSATSSCSTAATIRPPRAAIRLPFCASSASPASAHSRHRPHALPALEKTEKQARQRLSFRPERPLLPSSHEQRENPL